MVLCQLIENSISSLYAICSNKHITVAEAVRDNFRNVRFLRQLSHNQFFEWCELQQVSLSCLPIDRVDKIEWGGRTDGTFSTKEMYLWIDNRGVQIDYFSNIWQMKLPLKIKIFLWILSKRKLLTKVNLRAKGWDGDTTCVYCTREENVDHLFFTCRHHRGIWDWFLQQFNIRRPRSLEELFNSIWLIDTHYRSSYQICLSAIVWIIWLNRNDVCFNNSTQHSTRSFALLIKGILVYWSDMWTKEEKDRVLKMIPDIELIPLQIENVPDATHGDMVMVT